jgi:aspartate racemase
MKTLGLIGGMSWHSTLEYYRVINELVAARRGGHASARISLQSLDFDEIRACQVNDDWDRAAQLLSEAGRRCEQGGADVVLICTNLMHRVADQVQDAIDVPLLHIADALADAATARGWDRVGVLGTKWVMEEDWYVGRLARAGLTVDVPDAAERTEVDRVVFEELTLGRVEASSRATYVDLLRGFEKQGAQAAVLGCTEIELLVGAEDSPLPLLDSMRTHAEAAVEHALS